MLIAIASAARTDPGQASLLVLEAGFTLLAGAVALCWPAAGSRWFRRVEVILMRLARRRAMSVLTVGASAILLRLALLPLEPIPQPFIHDEFSYLLAADTFASGRLTNPTHPMWTHFESFHIDQQPNYMSMYFPAQGLMMAAGQVLCGNPWYGVLLSVGLMCAALCWMFQGWLPPGWALLGGMLAVVRLGLFSNWVNGYYGGAVAAAGGALVLGAFPRMLRRANAKDGVILAMGAIILANSRPYEGLLVCGPAFLWLFWKAFRTPQRRTVLARSMIVPALLVLIAAGLMARYNQRVFGSALTLPYQINRMTYASAPVFLWELPRPAPEYRSKEMHDFFQIWEMHDFRLARTPRGFLDNTVQKFATAVLFFFGFALLIPQLKPGAFLPAAELTGVIVPLGAWVLDRACAQFRQWRDQGIEPRMIAVNLSASQLKLGLDFCDFVQRILEKWGLAPRDLEFDVPEAVLSEAYGTNSNVLKKLRDLGVRLAIDDFGAEYTSMGRVKAYRVERLKIAPYFIKAMTSDDADAASVRLMIQLAARLGLEIVAKSVETQEQQTFLASTPGDAKAQGFYYSRPLPAELATDFLRREQVRSHLAPADTKEPEIIPSKG